MNNKFIKIINLIFNLQKESQNIDQHWIYYLFGGIFLIVSIIPIIFAVKWKNSRSEFENYNYEYNEFKKFWELNKFAFMVMLSVILIICGVVFLVLNNFISQNPTY